MSQPNVFRLTGVVAQKHTSAKLSLPVDRAALLYSRYKYVRGSSPLGQATGLPLSKLRALDNLIERLVRMHSTKPLVRQTADLTDNEIEGLMESYRSGLHQAISKASDPLQFGGTFDDTAISLNIVA